MMLIIVLFASCKTKRVVLTNTVTETITETLHDTTFVVEADSSWYDAFIECRDGKPVLTNPTAGAGKNLKKPKVSLADNGRLNVDCETKALELFAQWKSTHKATVIEKEVPLVIEKPLTQWQVLLINLGKIFGVLLIAALGYTAFRIYKNVKK